MTAIPPLLAIASGRKARPRKAPIERPKEIRLHLDVARVLREHCLPEWRWGHISSGELRTIQTAARLKRMGAPRGSPDFLLISPCALLRCLELKRIGETLTDDQEQFRLWCSGHGIPHVVGRTFDEALAAFDRWDCLRIELPGRAREGGSQ
jgi:hypothetical protein